MRKKRHVPPLTTTPPGPSVTSWLAGTDLFFFVGAPVTGGAKMWVWYVCRLGGSLCGPTSGRTVNAKQDQQKKVSNILRGGNGYERRLHSDPTPTTVPLLDLPPLAAVAPVEYSLSLPLSRSLSFSRCRSPNMACGCWRWP